MELNLYRAHTKSSSYTVDQLVESAARQKYGENIRVLTKNFFVDRNIRAFWNRFRINSVRMIGNKPVETRRTIADINTKTYINRGTDQGESTVEITKKTEQSKGRSYEWSTTEGVTWGINASIGAQIAGVAGPVTAGVTAGLGGSYQHQKTEQRTESKTTSEAFSFQYAQKETFVVPPRTKVNATITTYAVRHEQEYTVEFAFPVTTVIIRYKVPLQRCFADFCSNRGFITASDILGGLPGYREEDGWVYFTQAGKLRWSGEGCKVDKTEEPLTE